ncbi:SDR family NAD(P)-dependent oxidoreductase [Nocardia arthritidis]|nr:SDR family NAD(P)-dependent oxidoreductase [Nocardia arthritidis]
MTNATRWTPERVSALVMRIVGPHRSADAAALQRAVAGKIVVITGASYGLGAATARLLGSAGATVVLAARSEGRLGEVAADIEATGGEAFTYRLDLADAASVAHFASRVLGEHGHVDYLIHNAGKSLRRSIHLSYDRPKDLDATIGANMLGPMRLTLDLLPSMRARGRGHIVNVSTVGVLFPVAPKWAFYLASKAGFDTWMRSVAMESRTDGVGLTTVYAGLMHTRMSAPSAWMRRLPGHTPDQAAQIIAYALVHRPRVLAPMYGRVSRIGAALAPVPIERLLEHIHRHHGDTEEAELAGLTGIRRSGLELVR